MITQIDRPPAALNSKKYKVVERGGKRYYLHRLKAGLKKKSGGRKSKLVVDHIDNNTKDDAKKNLRVITRGANVGKANKLRRKRRKR